MFNLTNNLRKIAAGALLSLGAVAASSAVAAPVFQVNPNTNGLATTGTIFQADGMNGNASVRIQRVGATNQYTGTGYIIYTAFTLNDNPVFGGTSQLNNSYLLYATFNQTFTCGGPLAVGVSCNVDSISLSLWGDAGGNNGYSSASIAADPMVTVNGTDVKLADVNAGVGQAGLNALGGAFQNINTNFMLTAAGKLFFIDPVPFYSFAFSSFNNTSQGIACNTGPGCPGNPSIVAITQEAGFTDFNGTTVPEPGPLALIGLGLFGMMVARRKSRAA